jgi:hypothetical protein
VDTQLKVYAKHTHKKPNPPIGRNWKLALLETQQILNGAVTELKELKGDVTK